ncbi:MULTISPECIES: GNAT family N-acetyltransferase [Pseudoalteromonas]|jgi:predicted N-acyltransferase|uniref:N-acetyltransferase n=1 Tax=Pseudoalteromonas distincta TaxID=77608 RepID=A0A4P9J4C0_9GAMM|nr:MULTISPECIES: GNAT family N-acetyltransferase [Pseudoalteromonas]MBB1278063.1 N-acetyltransferase [Pseudoalteromonas sp. SR43-3]MBB1282040.1 N-acetyltransferase [Pseudoalteromonas sp. SR41-1]MBB1351268.1 N-acetyltransferase [Pseudoalteromonas sp. SG45-3]MBB1359624.1 N-acetyltransferase [Pseudoalteromonas sp. SG45-6]MBB1431806.1 N-acetyltransferase [Pseudoalteromonas sp. SG43-4]
MGTFSHQWFSSINEIDQAQWQRLFGDEPFTQHAFLYALEQSQCVTQKSGWQPHHLAIFEDDTLIALAPGYLKSHSYGEYVFDWAWAEAYEKHGLEYYPKWLSGIPFSPIEGKRIAIEHANPNAVYQYITEQLNIHSAEQRWSGWHVNFCDQAQATSLTEQHAMLRVGVQFQWFNKGFETFDDFLQILNSRKRKSLKKERAKIAQQNIDIEWLQGTQITPEIMQLFCEFYQRTYLKRSGHLGYLNMEFFTLLHALMANNLVIMLAKKDDNVIAATLSLVGENTLYGRYWGASEEVDSLHFELCYYQGIEFAIKHKLSCFHSGAQGEHKIARGFEPVLTYSAHHIVDGDFSNAISDYLKRERGHIDIYKEQCSSLLPFKNE